MKDKQLWGGVLIIIVAFGGFIYWQRNAPGEYDNFAQCLTDSGAKEYGAYWCPNCQAQKEDFGNSFKHVDYIECAMPGGSHAGQTAECTREGIESYPTWEFGDGTRVSGRQSLFALAAKTGCSLDGTEPTAPVIEEGAATSATPVTNQTSTNEITQ